MSNSVAYVAPVKDIPLGARIRYPGETKRVWVLIGRYGGGEIVAWRDDMPRGWLGQMHCCITDNGSCLDMEMEVLHG